MATDRPVIIITGASEGIGYAIARKLVSQEFSAVQSFDEQYAPSPDACEHGVRKQTLGIEAIGRRDGDGIARLTEGSGGGGADGGKHQVALLIEQRCAESYGIRTGEDDEVEGLEGPELSPQPMGVRERFDVDGG